MSGVRIVCLAVRIVCSTWNILCDFDLTDEPRDSVMLSRTETTSLTAAGRTRTNFAPMDVPAPRPASSWSTEPPVDSVALLRV